MCKSCCVCVWVCVCACVYVYKCVNMFLCVRLCLRAYQHIFYNLLYSIHGLPLATKTLTSSHLLFLTTTLNEHIDLTQHSHEHIHASLWRLEIIQLHNTSEYLYTYSLSGQASSSLFRVHIQDAEVLSVRFPKEYDHLNLAAKHPKLCTYFSQNSVDL